MTLKEMKKKVLRLIEEISTNTNNTSLTDDPDIAAKINDVINQIQNELARIKKIPVRDEFDVTEGEVEQFDDWLENYYQVNLIKGVKHYIYEDTVEFLEDGKAVVYYYKYPKQITAETDADEYKFELSRDALEIMPYGVAADLLKSDISANYGQVYANRYETMLQRLDPRYHTGSIYIDTGDDYSEFL